MDVYVETNFVLELALLQEQQESCRELLNLAEAGKINLVLPAFSLTEPYEKLIRSKNTRKKLSDDLRRELSQLGRSLPYQEQANTFQEITKFLVNSGTEENQRFQRVLEKLLLVSEVIPLTVDILIAAIKYQSELNFAPQDAIVYASIVKHLNMSLKQQRCFINRNSKDFDNPDIEEALDRYNCKILFRFDAGLGYVRNQIGFV
ncbi:PIN domain-containing protein [Anabaena azotica]|uniref:PIN domain-containing protein n=1 Tax=Anabaena azotica TaxID=197653 RepID=UPI0039A46009